MHICTIMLVFLKEEYCVYGFRLSLNDAWSDFHAVKFPSTAPFLLLVSCMEHRDLFN